MNNIKNLITKYKNQNREILDRRPELGMYGDFTPDGIRFFCNSSFIEDLQAINYNRCSLTLEDLKVNRFEVIDKVGRAYVKYCDRPLNIETSLQDDDRTLKVFLDD